jgi:transposase-like protein
MQCCGCGQQVSVTAGTVFQDTRTPLTVWFRAMWWITSQKNGVSALGLQQVLGWGSYQTAWTCLHKLRRAMIRPGRDRLSGAIEVDEGYLGGLEAGSHGRGAQRKVLIAVAAEEDGRGTGRIRLQHLGDASAASLTSFIKDSIEPGSFLHTDGWQGYASISKHGYRHKVTLIKRRSENTSELLPRAHRVISLLKRWLLGTHQGAVGIDHLQEYLDEFAFRFNRRKSRSRGKLFYRLVQQAVAIPPTTYRALVDSNNSRNHRNHNPLGLPE